MRIPFIHPRQTTSCQLPSFDDQQVQGLCDLYSPDPQDANTGQARDVADVLLEQGKIDQATYVQIRRQRASDKLYDPATFLVQQKLATTLDIQKAKATLHGLEFKQIGVADVDKAAFEKLPIDLVRRFRILPIRIEGQTLVAATPEPENTFAIEEAKRQTQMPIQLLVCMPEDIDTVCNALHTEQAEYDLDDIISDMAEVEVVQDQKEHYEDLEQMAGQSPVIKFVNYLISNAIREGASDIHIEPKEKTCRIRYRIDGILFDAKEAPIKMHPAIVSRIKIMANLDISERRLPQDGKISAIVGGRPIDLRVSTLPTSHGEKTVIRILDSRSIILTLEQLGMEDAVCQAFRRQIELPHGILLVTGPTGSGKSTTLYTALRHMDGDRLNISTVEDPVEYQLDFCNQLQVNEKIGLTFAAALRSLLRQDPDIIMVGEIRDAETAHIAVQAALTGHLVLSTLHTNDAPSSVTRLVDIGIEPYLIAASLNAVLAQRLVRKICPACKQPFHVPDKLKALLDRAGLRPDEVFHGAGCNCCRGSGYSGRIGIYELLIVDDRMRELITADASITAMRKAFTESGADTLFDDGMKKVKAGLTTIEEVLRVTQQDSQSEPVVAG